MAFSKMKASVRRLGPDAEAQMRAAAVDLRFLHGFLLDVERKAREAGRGDAERERLARRLAARVGGIAATLEEAVAGET